MNTSTTKNIDKIKDTRSKASRKSQNMASSRNPRASRAKGSGDKSAKPRKFAEGLCFKKLFFIFLVGSVIGAIYEDLLIFAETYFTTGTGVWMLHRGVIYGPFNVIYGFGAALMCWVLLRKPYEDWQIFLLAAGLGGLVEYMLSFFQELVTHTTSWDYHGMWLNLNGRTTIPFMLVWGAMGLLLVKVIYPFVSRLIEQIPPQTGEILFTILLVLMIVDMTISWSALIRRALRHNDIPALTPVGEFYDHNYPDEFLVKYFPNMKWTK